MLRPIHGKALKLEHHPTWRTFGFSQHPFSGKNQVRPWNLEPTSEPQKEKKNYQLSGSMLNFDKFIIDLHWLTIHFDPPQKNGVHLRRSLISNGNPCGFGVLLAAFFLTKNSNHQGSPPILEDAWARSWHFTTIHVMHWTFIKRTGDNDIVHLVQIHLEKKAKLNKKVGRESLGENWKATVRPQEPKLVHQRSPEKNWAEWSCAMVLFWKGAGAQQEEPKLKLELFKKCMNCESHPWC